MQVPPGPGQGGCEEHRASKSGVGGGSPTATCCLNCRSDCAAICFPWSSSDFECGEIHVLNLAGGRASTVRAFLLIPEREGKEGHVEFICQKGREGGCTHFS
jgi:hypothetical protein